VRRAVVFVSAGLILCAPAYGDAETLSMPRELVDEARRQGCEQVPDFFERPGFLEPPYAYGYAPGPAEASVVFWCQRGEGPQRKFWLVIKTTAGTGGPTCPNKIEWPYKPGGVTIERGAKIDPEEFRYVSNPTRRVDKAARFALAGIRTAYDGSSFTFYCSNGEWVVRSRP
jgi:hypothetical protein